MEARERATWHLIALSATTALRGAQESLVSELKMQSSVINWLRTQLFGEVKAGPSLSKALTTLKFTTAISWTAISLVSLF